MAKAGFETTSVWSQVVLSRTLETVVGGQHRAGSRDSGPKILTPTTVALLLFVLHFRFLDSDSLKASDLGKGSGRRGSVGKNFENSTLYI